MCLAQQKGEVLARFSQSYEQIKECLYLILIMFSKHQHKNIIFLNAQSTFINNFFHKLINISKPFSEHFLLAWSVHFLYIGLYIKCQIKGVVFGQSCNFNEKMYHFCALIKCNFHHIGQK